MSGDFLQSNKYSPSTMTEGFLKKIRVKMTKKSQDSTSKTTDNVSSKSRSDCSHEGQTDIFERSQHDKKEEKSEGKDQSHVNCTSGNDKSKVSHNFSQETRFPKLKQILFNGLVRIARPSSNLKSSPDPNSDTSSSTKTEETAVSMVASFPPDETSGSSSPIHNYGEVGYPNVYSEVSCHQNNMDLNHKETDELTNIIQFENFMSNNNSENQPNSPAILLDNGCDALQCLSNLTMTASGNQEQKNPNEKTSSQIGSSRTEEETSEIKEAVNIPISDSLSKLVKADANGTISFPLDDPSNVNNRQSLLYKTIDLFGSKENNLSESSVSNTSKIYTGQESENALIDCVGADVDISSEKNSKKGKPFPNILQILFDLRLKIRYKDDDTEPLVEEEIFEDVNAQAEEKEQNIKKRSSNFKLPLNQQKHKKDEGPRRPSLIIASKRKRKRPRKKDIKGSSRLASQ